MAKTEAGHRIDLTVDLASPIETADLAGLVRLVGEPSDVDDRFVAVLNSGSARQIAAALLSAADQADEIDHDVSRPRPTTIR